MSKLTCAVLVLLLLACASSSWAVSNAVVGICRTGTAFTTIQSAINAADVGSTIQVCPGTYPEVLTITNNVTIKGVAAGTSNAVVITVPSTGVPANGLSGLWGTLDVQVVVKGAAVNLSNLIIDQGGATTCPTTTDTPVAIMFQGVNGGSMTNSVIRNAPTGCAQVLGAFVDVSNNFTFAGNNLTDCIYVCVEVDYDGANINIKNNFISSVVTTNLAIDTQYVTGPVTISGNVAGGNLAYGMAAQFSTGVTMTGNSIMTTSHGGAFVLWASTLSVVENNHGTGYYGAIVNDLSAVGGNTVTRNTFMGGYCGIGTYKLNKGDTTTGNTSTDMTLTTCKAG